MNLRSTTRNCIAGITMMTSVVFQPGNVYGAEKALNKTLNSQTKTAITEMISKPNNPCAQLVQSIVENDIKPKSVIHQLGEAIGIAKQENIQASAAKEISNLSKICRSKIQETVQTGKSKPSPEDLKNLQTAAALTEGHASLRKIKTSLKSVLKVLMHKGSPEIMDNGFKSGKIVTEGLARHPEDKNRMDKAGFRIIDGEIK